MSISLENETEFFKDFIIALLGHYIDNSPERKWVQLNMDVRKQRQRIANDELLLMIEKLSLQKVERLEKLWVAIFFLHSGTELSDLVIKKNSKFRYRT